MARRHRFVKRSLPTSPRFGTRLASSGSNGNFIRMAQERSSSLEEDRIRNAYARRPSDSTLNTWSNASFVFRVHERERLLLKLLTRYGFMPLLGRRILEVGCGNGSWLREFIQWGALPRSEEHTSELQSPYDLVCRLLLEKKNITTDQ